MNFHYPLQALARRRGTAAQFEFAHEARAALFDSDEAIFEAHAHGLEIFATHEEALQQPARLLRQIYGDFLEIRGPTIRRMPGDPEHEPVMHVRITTRREHAHRVMAELRRREARIVEECSRPRIFIVRAEAPLRSLLGLPAWLEAVAGADASHAIRLLRYAPMEQQLERSVPRMMPGV